MALFEKFKKFFALKRKNVHNIQGNLFILFKEDSNFGL